MPQKPTIIQKEYVWLGYRLDMPADLARQLVDVIEKLDEVAEVRLEMPAGEGVYSLYVALNPARRFFRAKDAIVMAMADFAAGNNGRFTDRSGYEVIHPRVFRQYRRQIR